MAYTSAGYQSSYSSRNSAVVPLTQQYQYIVHGDKQALLYYLIMYHQLMESFSQESLEAVLDNTNISDYDKVQWVKEALLKIRSTKEQLQKHEDIGV